jgi:hypothetical protein
MGERGESGQGKERRRAKLRGIEGSLQGSPHRQEAGGGKQEVAGDGPALGTQVLVVSMKKTSSTLHIAP